MGLGSKGGIKECIATFLAYLHMVSLVFYLGRFWGSKRVRGSVSFIISGSLVLGETS